MPPGRTGPDGAAPDAPARLAKGHVMSRMKALAVEYAERRAAGYRAVDAYRSAVWAVGPVSPVGDPHCLEDIPAALSEECRDADMVDARPVVVTVGPLDDDDLEDGILYCDAPECAP